MNKLGIFSEGPANGAVQFRLNGLPFPSKLIFIPSFYQDRIYQVSAFIQYDSWAPWNRRLQADSLQLDMVSLLQRWYKRDDFVVINKPGSNERAFVFLDANRRITVVKDNDTRIRVIFKDISVNKMDLPVK